MRFFQRGFRHDHFSADLSTWLWLIGATVVSCIGLALFIRALRPRNASR
ncbi:hypothetical protein ACFOLC_03820 [Lysobacter cavernae]|uniref:ABC transporter permease n=1 Tax=Lysobacter cavernae TaxID=1685901 RepID=A0ABV7RL86_9GAMM